MKRFLSLILVLCLFCFCAAGCSVRGRKNAALKLINKYPKEIPSLAVTALATGEVPEDALFPGVESILVCQPDWVEFCTGSRGEGTDTAYCGFYFSAKDVALGFRGQEMELTPENSGFSWYGEGYGADGNDNHYYTERMDQNWFYYEMYY